MTAVSDLHIKQTFRVLRHVMSAWRLRWCDEPGGVRWCTHTCHTYSSVTLITSYYAILWCNRTILDTKNRSFPGNPNEGSWQLYTKCYDSSRQIAVRIIDSCNCVQVTLLTRRLRAAGRRASQGSLHTRVLLSTTENT
jgi:hypothetical protein